MSAVMHLVADAGAIRADQPATAGAIEVTGGSSWISATGSIDTLIANGLCTRAHLPAGRGRRRYEKVAGDGPIAMWRVQLLLGRRAMLTVWYRDSQTRAHAVDDARCGLKHLPSTEDAWRNRACMYLGFSRRMVECMDSDRYSRGGYRLSDADGHRLQEIQRQVDALLSRAELILANAKPVFDAEERARIVAELEAVAYPKTMPPLPPVALRVAAG